MTLYTISALCDSVCCLRVSHHGLDTAQSGGVTMNDDTCLRKWAYRVAHGTADRREFLRSLMALGLSGPFLGNWLATVTPAAAQTTATRHGV